MHVVPSIDHSLHFLTLTISWQNYCGIKFAFGLVPNTSPSSNLSLTWPYQLSRRFLPTASPSMPSWNRRKVALSAFSCRSQCKLSLLPAYWPTIPWCTQRPSRVASCGELSQSGYWGNHSTTFQKRRTTHLRVCRSLKIYSLKLIQKIL